MNLSEISLVKIALHLDFLTIQRLLTLLNNKMLLLVFIYLFPVLNHADQFQQRGTVVEKLTEEILRDWGHVIQLLSICEGNTMNSFFWHIINHGLEFTINVAAQRQIGETAFNETSSRSHQIIRLVKQLKFLVYHAIDFLIQLEV